jgi:hypothetical protein
MAGASVFPQYVNPLHGGTDRVAGGTWLRAPADE